MSTSPIGPSNGLLSPMNSQATSPTSSASNSSASNSSSSNASTQSAVDALGDPDTFLKLLVAQLQYQDPQSPADGTTFVTQLATFAGVEEQSAMRGDLDSINTVAQKYETSLTSTAASTGSTTPASTQSSDSTPANGSGTGNATGTSPSTGSTGTSN